MALSKMKTEGGITVRELSKSVTWDKKVVSAVKLLSYRDMRPKEPLLLQVELTLPRSDQPWRIDEAALSVQGTSIWKRLNTLEHPTLSNDGLYLLLWGEVNMGRPNTLHSLTLTTQGGQNLIIRNIPIP
jgi:hypothetical protein